MSTSATVVGLITAVLLTGASGGMVRRHDAPYPTARVTVHKLAGVASVVLAGRWVLCFGPGGWTGGWLLGVGTLLTVGVLASGGLLLATPYPGPVVLRLGHCALGITTVLALCGVSTAALLGAGGS